MSVFIAGSEVTDWSFAGHSGGDWPVDCREINNTLLFSSLHIVWKAMFVVLVKEEKGRRRYSIMRLIAWLGRAGQSVHVSMM